MLDRLQSTLEPPCRLGGYELTGLVARTATALVYLACGGLFGRQEGILKLAARKYAPLLERELAILVRCEQAGVNGVIRPTSASLQRLRLQTDLNVVCMALPFCHGGNLVNVIAGRRSRGLGSGFALEVGVHVGSVLRHLLALPKPVVHGDVRAENVLLPSPAADLAQLTVIDFDAARELSTAFTSSAPESASAAALAGDVRGFGELLWQAATGRESANQPDLATGNASFDAFVLKCQSSVPAVEGSYACLADRALWRDLHQAIAAERGR